MKKYILLDRDGVLNVNLKDSVKSVEEFKFLPHSLEALSLLQKENFQIAIVTNQAVVGRGIITHNVLDQIHAHMKMLFSEKNICIEAIFSCTSADPSDPRRKPNPGLIFEALTYFKASPHEALLIGDSLRDLEAAARAGCERYLVLTGNGKKTLKEGIPPSVHPLNICKNLLTAVKKILREK